MYKSFYEQVFYNQGSTRVYKNALQALDALQPYFKESKGIQASVAAFLQDSPSKNFFPTSRLMQERRKIYYRRASYKKSNKICCEYFVLRFAQFKESKGFYMTSYVQGQRSVCPKPRIPFFWFTSIGVQKQPVLVEVLAPTRLALQGSHVQR
jgi:hypothetical protein